MATSIEVRDVNVDVVAPGGRLPVLRDISLDIAPGELVALMGPSGSGKTTLLNVIGGLEPNFRGTVRLDGEQVWSEPGTARAEVRNDRIGFVFQEANLIQGLSAEENLMVPLLLRSAPARSERVRDILDRCGLADRAHTRVERQRVSTARALVGDPGLVLVDEPTGSLDAENVNRIIQLLLDYRTEHGATLLIATHDARVAERIDRVVRMENGHIDGSS